MGVFRKVGSFGKVLAEESVGVFVGASLPWALGVAEVGPSPDQKEPQPKSSSTSNSPTNPKTDHTPTHLSAAHNRHYERFAITGRGVTRVPSGCPEPLPHHASGFLCVHPGALPCHKPNTDDGRRRRWTKPRRNGTGDHSVQFYASGCWCRREDSNLHGAINPTRSLA